MTWRARTREIAATTGATGDAPDAAEQGRARMEMAETEYRNRSRRTTPGSFGPVDAACADRSMVRSTASITPGRYIEVVQHFAQAEVEI